MRGNHSLLRSKPILFALALAAIWMGAYVLFQAPTVSVSRQKTIQTKTNANALLQAVEFYFQHYSRLPESAGENSELETEGEGARVLLLTLLGKDEEGNDRRGKQIRFLNVEETRSKQKGGLLYQNGGTSKIPEGLYDAWGRPFHVRFDTLYKGEIPDPLQAGETIHNKIAIVYSYGKDGKPGGGDDIKTW